MPWISRALGPRDTLSDFATQVDALSVRDWISRNLFDYHRDGSADHFDSGFSQMVMRSSHLHYNLDVILNNTHRLEKMEQIFNRYFHLLSVEHKAASFYGLTNFRGFNTKNPPDSPTFSEMELFVILSNRTLLAKTQFYRRQDSQYVKIPVDEIVARFSWMKRMFRANGQTASQNFEFDRAALSNETNTSPRSSNAVSITFIGLAHRELKII